MDTTIYTNHGIDTTVYTVPGLDTTVYTNPGSDTIVEVLASVATRACLIAEPAEV